MECHVVEIVQFQFRFLQLLEFPLGIIDECAKLPDFLVAHGITIKFIHFAAYVARCVPHHMIESFVFSMYVGDEMFGALREV